MQNTLLEMWKRYNLLLSFKVEMNKRGHASKDLYCLHAQLYLLMELIEIESESVLSLLLQKTYFRIFQSIDKGIEYLPEIVYDPEGWTLNKIEDDNDAWISKDVLIFTCKSTVATFSRISRKETGYRYVLSSSKWQ